MKRKDFYRNFIAVGERPTIGLLLFSIATIPVFIGILLLRDWFTLKYAYKIVDSLDERGKWIYNKAIDDGMSWVDINKGVGMYGKRLRNYRPSIPYELKTKDDKLFCIGALKL